MLSAEARELLALLREFGHLVVDDLEVTRDGATVDGALAELRERRLISIHLTSRGRKVAAVTDRGRR